MYSIELVAKRLGLKFRKNGTRDSLYYDCPLCGDKRAKFNINTKFHVWKCNVCGEGGGVVSLVEAVLCCSKDDAINFLRKNHLVTEQNLKNNHLKEEFLVQEKIADEKTLDHTYRKMLDFLYISKPHLNSLLSRGFNYKSIEFFKFRSLPRNNDTTLPKKLLNAGCTLDGVPGFFKENNVWKINAFPQGFLIPFINTHGYITGFQIRNDKPSENAGKYMSLSSTGKDYGTKSHIEAHLVGFNGQKAVYLTEGALKADLAYFILRKRSKKEYAFLAIPGVNNTASLDAAFKHLKENGVETIVDAFDMDKIGNESVIKNQRVTDAIEKIKNIAESNGLSFKTIVWRKEKGIDDFLISKKKNH